MATTVTTAAAAMSPLIRRKTQSSLQRHFLFISSLSHNYTTSNNHPNRPFSSSSSSHHADAETTTHFGYQSIPIDQKESKVRQVFSNVAESYDVMNDLMSGGLHRLWKDELCNMTGLAATARAIRGTTTPSTSPPPLSLKILDVAGGTGDIAFRLIDTMNCIERAKSSGQDELSVTICDINHEMLRVGEQRARQRYGNDLLESSQALRFVQGNAQSLPFSNNEFDLYTIAFGLRNVTDVDEALRDAYRVLKPGGRYLCLEFSNVENLALRALYDVYSFHVIPGVGEVVAGDRGSYQYLVESIRKFGGQEELKGRMVEAGFENVSYRNMTGGIVAVHEGWKPL